MSCVPTKIPPDGCAPRLYPNTLAVLLQLTDDEVTYIELKLALGDQLKTMREKKAITPVELARLMSSSQSQVAKMESGEPSVSIDRFVKALLALGATRKQIASAVAPARAA